MWYNITVAKIKTICKILSRMLSKIVFRRNGVTLWRIQKMPRMGAQRTF